jgi:hypothetical protein
LTKKTPTPVEASWQDALARFDDWQLARGMGEKTRRAYGVDLTQLAEWAAGRDLRPEALSHRELRHFAGVVSERGAMKSTVARKLAAIRTFYRHMVERGDLAANPAELVSSPKKDAYLPRVLKPDEVSELLERIPGSTPLDLRDRALLELAYAAGLRAEELVNLDVQSLDPDAEEVRVEGKRGRARLACARPLPGARPHGAQHGRQPGPVPVQDRQAAVHVGHQEAAAAPDAPRGRLPAHAAPLVRDPPAGGRGRSAYDPGAVGAFQYQHDPDIHSGRVETPQEGVRALSPSCVTQDSNGDKSQGHRAPGPLAPL